jgi:DNA polymerase-1
VFEIFQDPESEFYQPKKLLLIDWPYAMYRSYFGYDVERFRTNTGQPNNCIYGVAQLVNSLIAQEKPTHFAFTGDVSRAGHRKDILPQYKEGRTPTPEELSAQFPIVREMINLMNIPLVEKERYESDDIIATYAHNAASENFKVQIFSSDRDMYQLVTENVQIIRPCARKEQYRSNFEYITPRIVEERYGLPPARYPEHAALVGEKADNIPGVPGIGTKTATKLLLEFDGLDNLLENASAVKGKIGEALQEHLDQVRINRQVNRLLTDVDLPLGLESLTLEHPNSTKLADFFTKWQIPSLVRKCTW